MALRLVEIFHYQGNPDDLKFLLSEVPLLEFWYDRRPQGETIIRILVEAVHMDQVIDILKSFYGNDKLLRMVVLAVDASIPGVQNGLKAAEGDEAGQSPEEEEGEKKEKTTRRTSIEELYQKVSEASSLGPGYILMICLASIVAAIGLMMDDVAVVIGSMVIAPLLGPHVGLALSSVLGDPALLRKAAPAILAGTGVVLVIGLGAGLVIPEETPLTHQLLARADIRLAHIPLAAAAGIAGVYSMTTGISEVLVGVMVAVALLPPLVASGILFAHGDLLNGAGAFTMFLVNAVSINLAGVVTFALEGIRPLKIWEEKKAKKATILSLVVNALFLIVLVVAIYVEHCLKLKTGP